MNSVSEEDYIKAIYQIAKEQDGTQVVISTNAIANKIKISPASVTDMLKKLSAKGIVIYKKYNGCTLSNEGAEKAKSLVRKHRLWETFLVNKLGFGWEEVHSIAEQLEHIQSVELIERLDKYLGHPLYDPHGDPIPNKKGEFPKQKGALTRLSQLSAGVSGVLVRVSDDVELLRYLERLNLGLNDTVIMKEKFPFDDSMEIDIKGQTVRISKKIGDNLLVKPL